MTSRKIETRRLDVLRDHPQQDELAGDISPAALDELARDMDGRGLQQPIEILPDGTIICGHQRVRAARNLGWEEIDVIVRGDLGSADDPNLLYHLIADNALRRQADPLAIARTYLALRNLDQGCECDELRYNYRSDLRDRIGQLLGMTGRNLDRLVKLLDLPRPIQDAVSNKKLTQKVALKVRKLSENEQLQIATAITEGRPAKEVVNEYFAPSDNETDSQIKRYARFMHQLENAVVDLSPHLDHVTGNLPGSTVTLLDRGIGMLEQLRERELEIDREELEQDSADDFDEDV